MVTGVAVRLRRGPDGSVVLITIFTWGLSVMALTRIRQLSLLLTSSFSSLHEYFSDTSMRMSPQLIVVVVLPLLVTVLRVVVLGLVTYSTDL